MIYRILIPPFFLSEGGSLFLGDPEVRWPRSGCLPAAPRLPCHQPTMPPLTYSFSTLLLHHCFSCLHNISYSQNLPILTT